MWAWHRIDGLLKQADRNGARNQEAINQVVRLGEAYSIVTEYTSFLVLENDVEFQRWKIARNNALRTERDRQAQLLVRAQFEKLRGKVFAELGPEPSPLSITPAQPLRQRVAPSPAPQPQPLPKSEPSPPPAPSQSFNLHTGSGPVGPLTIVVLVLASRLKRRQNRSS